MGNTNSDANSESQIDKSAWGTYADVMSMVKLADIIEVDREDYRHFAMFVGVHKEDGRGTCVHVYQDDHSGDGKRHLQFLDIVIGGHRARINNKIKEATERGLRERVSKNDQVNDAMRSLSMVTLVDFEYSVLTNNCETQVTKWKYGTGFSKQVENVVARVLKGKINISLSSRSSSSRSRSVGGGKNVKTQ